MNVHASRRNFLKAAGAAGCLAPFCGISSLSWAASANANPLLVVVFLRGGADGLGFLAPTDDPDYVAARPPELRLLDSGERAGLPLSQRLEPRLDFRLHPEARPLLELYQSRQLAFAHGVGLTDGTRSHFVAQDLMERGLADEKRLASVGDGWLARATAGQSGLVPTASATAAPATALRGAAATFATPDLAGGSGLPWGEPSAQFLSALYNAGNSTVHVAGAKALHVLDTIDRQIPKDGNGRPLPYKAEGNASYDNLGDLSRSLTSIARLARMDIGLSVACVDHGGWDTHENQVGRLNTQIRQLAAGLAAFNNDLSAAGRKTTLLVMTEFGRRLRTNKSGGTDHGHGACWLALGEKVRGGDIYGRWPGLATAHLDQGVDLAVTTDYRTVLAECLSAVGLPSRQALPDWKAKQGVGLFSA